MLIIGSYALNYYHWTRLPNDLDLIATFPEFQDFCRQNASIFEVVYPIADGKKYACRLKHHPVKFRTSLMRVPLVEPRSSTYSSPSCSTLKPVIEVEIAWKNSSAERLLTLVKTFQGDRFQTKREGIFYSHIADIAPLPILLALKTSHRFLKNSPFFEKTRADYFLLRDLVKGPLPAALLNWIQLREAETYNYSHPNLNQKKDGFFNGDGITYIYDHDSIHEAMKIGETPAYKKFQANGAEVKVSKGKWLDLSDAEKLHSVIEESYVLALERSQIPFRGRWSPEQSFKVALQKVCTSISSGWWREYAYEKYDEVLQSYDRDYVARFWHAVDHGKVKEAKKT